MRARRPQRRDHRRIVAWPKIAQCRRAARGRIVARVDAVLDRYRQPEQRPRRGARSAFEVAGARRFEHAWRFERDERAERLPRAAPSEQRLGITLGLQLAARHQRDRRGRAQCAQLRVVGCAFRIGCRLARERAGRRLGAARVRHFNAHARRGRGREGATRGSTGSRRPRHSRRATRASPCNCQSGRRSCRPRGPRPTA